MLELLRIPQQHVKAHLGARLLGKRHNAEKVALSQQHLLSFQGLFLHRTTNGLGRFEIFPHGALQELREEKSEQKECPRIALESIA